MDRFHQQRTLHLALSTKYFALVLAMLILPGCATSSLFSKFTHRGEFPKATPNNPAVRILCMWQPAEGVGVDDRPARGVAGQIFFFTQGRVTPVEVEGDVRIFLFDDQGTEEEQATPLHQFDFVKGSWKAHLVPTQFGPAYQLFVPYSRKGHHLAELAMRVRLTPTNGPVIFSEITKVTLQGYDRKESDDKPSVAVSRNAANTAGSFATDNHDEAGASTEITPERVRQTFLQVLAERNNRSTTTPSRRGPNNDSVKTASPQTIPSSQTTMSTVGRIRMDQNGQSLLANHGDDSGHESAGAEFAVTDDVAAVPRPRQQRSIVAVESENLADSPVRNR